MDLTIPDIEKDIARFQSRIAKAKAEIAVLPVGRLPYQEHKRREKIKRDCEAEIKHCGQLCEYAREGISIRKTDKQ